jgi:hypothetical protein
MSQRVYRLAAGYWLTSILAVVSLVTILVVIIGGIPGFPNSAEMIARWQKAYSVGPYEAVVLAILWVSIVGFFAYTTLKTARLLVRPKLVKGTLQGVSTTLAGADSMLWIEVSGSRHRLRYDRHLSSRLDSVDMLGALVDIRIGVGDRVVSVDIVQERGAGGLDRPV